MRVNVGGWPALGGLRIGCVQYLNARPLIHAFEGPVRFGHPSDLARQMDSGELDAGLIPIFEALRGNAYAVVDGVAIACDGPVYSVFLAHSGPIREIRRVRLDPASSTSVHLLKVLLAEYHQLLPEYATGVDGPSEDPLLLIGNQAIEFRRSHADTHQFLDLGAEWKRCTGLPFVFALWLLRPDLPDLGLVAEGFRNLQKMGAEKIAEIISHEDFQDAEFRTAYLASHIRFRLGALEKEAIERFQALLSKHGFIRDADRRLAYC